MPSHYTGLARLDIRENHTVVLTNQSRNFAVIEPPIDGESADKFWRQSKNIKTARSWS